jgi:hypothetical protein
VCLVERSRGSRCLHLDKGDFFFSFFFFFFENLTKETLP